MDYCLRRLTMIPKTEFRPERWLPGADHPGCQQFCPGRGLAMLEIKAVTAKMSRCFSLAKASGHGPVKERFAFTLMPENLFVKFERRR